MPLSLEQVKALEKTRSLYGCGSETCVCCYPIQYYCAFCAESLPEPIRNGEVYECESCGWQNNGKDEVK